MFKNPAPRDRTGRTGTGRTDARPGRRGQKTKNKHIKARTTQKNIEETHKILKKKTEKQHKQQNKKTQKTQKTKNKIQKHNGEDHMFKNPASRKVREIFRIHFHLFWCLYISMVPSYDQKKLINRGVRPF